MQAFAGCFCSMKIKFKRGLGDEKIKILASETPFTVKEIKVLYDLFKKLSSSVIDDGLLHKEEFQLALFRNRNRQNLFADRIFVLFDVKQNGVIEFGEFVQSLRFFHPSAPEADKISFSFRLYDLRNTGFIENDENLKVEGDGGGPSSRSELILTDDDVQTIVNKTFMEVDTKGDGRIDLEEWKEYAAKHPSILKNMTLPYLKDLPLSFPQPWKEH